MVASTPCFRDRGVTVAISACVCILALASPIARASESSPPLTGCNPFTLADVANVELPRFEQFAAPAQAIANPAPVHIGSNPRARQFRTVLRDGARKGPNFAGHFTIVGWGCGAGCLDFAIVDAESGRVHFEPSLRAIDTTHAGLAPGEADPTHWGLRFRPDSRLLIVLGAPEENAQADGIAYYAWNGRTLERRAFVANMKRDCGH